MIAALILASFLGGDDEWKAGVTSVKITPEQPVHLSGYASRNKPFERVAADIYAKALALEAGGQRALLITTDLVGFNTPVADSICRAVMEKTRLRREEILLTASHNHSGPRVSLSLTPRGNVPPEEIQKSVDYTLQLAGKVAALAAEAFGRLEPVRLSWGVGVAPFVMNRREFTERGIVIGVNPRGLADRAVPVLRVDSPGGQLRAVVFGAACHNTTLTGSNYELCGDYAGFAQATLEEGSPGATAFFVLGCAGDSNPYPRGTMGLAREHGAALGKEVARVLGSKLAPVRGPLRTELARVDLPFQRLTRSELELLTGPQAGVARQMLGLLERGERLPTHYPAPIGLWQFGGDLTLVGLSGEAVADYVPLLERALGPEKLWVAAYCNDKFGYLPSARVAREGGYEAQGLTLGYGGPGFFSPEAEEAVASAVTTLAIKAGRRPRGLSIEVVDKATGKPLPCRIHLYDAAGKPQRAAGLPYWRDHFVCDGTVRLEVPAGGYRLEVERGPEWSRVARLVEGEKVRVELERLDDLPREGWWPGDLHVHRALEEVELLMRAEDLHVAPVITWWNRRNPWAAKELPSELLTRIDGNRFYHRMAGEDERQGGALLYFDLPRPLNITGAGREHPSPMKFLAEARKQEGVKVDIEKPFWWDVPTWLASGQVDTIGLANNHMCRSSMMENEAWGRARDEKRLPAPLGNGWWSQEIYYQILNAGLRVPPSAGSASGVLPNPVGYNRVYVHAGPELTYEKWWEGLRAGRSFVTNGPLLRVKANGQLPGHVFTAEKEITLELEIKHTGRDAVRAVEVVRNGQVEPAGPLTFRESGWFLVRVLADNAKTFRFASTAPFYVEIGGLKHRVSRASAQFFVDWVDDRMKRVKDADPAKLEEVLDPHRAARKFWQERVEKANAP